MQKIAGGSCQQKVKLRLVGAFVKHKVDVFLKEELYLQIQSW